MADRFTGYSEITIDDKGRVILPAKYREQIGRSITIQADPKSKTLKLYSKAEWDRRYEQLAEIDEDDAERAKIERMLMRTSEDNTPDGQWRLVLPPQFKKFLDLPADNNRDVVISGAGRYLRIWGREAFERFIASEE